MGFSFNPLTGKLDKVIKSYWKIVSSILRPIVAGINILIDGDLTVEGIFNSALILVEGDVDLYIAPTGSDTTGDGSVGNPWATPVKLVTEMARYRCVGIITGHIADGTYTNPTPTSDWIAVPITGQGEWVIVGNMTTPTSVVLDGDDANPASGNFLFSHFNRSIFLTVKGINFKNAYIHVNAQAPITVEHCTFDNYRYGINLANNCSLYSYGGGSKTMTFNGSTVTSAIGIRMLDNVSVTITENVRMTNNQYDIIAGNRCYCKLQESVASNYISTLSPTTARATFKFTGKSRLDFAMDMSLTGDGIVALAIAIDNDSYVYSFAGYNHTITNFIRGWFIGQGCGVDEPVNSNWTYTSVTTDIFAEQSAIITSADTLDSTITWWDSGVIRGYDQRYEQIGKNYTPKVFNQSAEPTTTDIASGEMAMWTDTDDSKCYVCYNHGGTVKTVELT